MALQKKITTKPKANTVISQPSERLTDAELQSLMEDFHQSIQELEEAEGIKLKHNFDKPFPPRKNSRDL